jgi:rubrerythrin
MDKETLLENLTKMIETEESAVSMYSLYIDDSMAFAPFENSVKTKIQDMLKKLGSDSTRHREMIRKLIQKTERNKKNAY